jgi:putative ABC transport system substrate-binding protein
MRRREFITLLGSAAVAWPVAARAQRPKMLRVGYSGILPREAPHYAAFEKRMVELGYQQGKNFTFEYIQALSIEGYELTYRELAARKVDIMLAAGNEPALRAAGTAAGGPQGWRGWEWREHRREEFRERRRGEEFRERHERREDRRERRF